MTFSTGPSIYWEYSPSLPAAITFCIIYAVLSAAHFYYRFRKNWRFVNAMAVGGLCKSIHLLRQPQIHP